MNLCDSDSKIIHLYDSYQLLNLNQSYTQLWTKIQRLLIFRITCLLYGQTSTVNLFPRTSKMNHSHNGIIYTFDFYFN